MKVSAKNSVILVNGYNFSTYFSSFEGNNSANPKDVTGFGDQSKNFIPTLTTATLSGTAWWDSAAAKTHLILSALPTGHVTIIPEGYSLGTPSISLPYMSNKYKPKGSPDDEISIGTLEFASYGNNVGLEAGVMLAHETITATTTGTGVLDPSDGAVTATCSATLHIWDAVATDTYVIKVQHSTLLGSGYADLITFTATGATLTSERISVASGTINKYRRVVATRTGSAGETLGYSVHFQHQ
jgi:hypothetical protein